MIGGSGAEVLDISVLSAPTKKCLSPYLLRCGGCSFGKKWGYSSFDWNRVLRWVIPPVGVPGSHRPCWNKGQKTPGHSLFVVNAKDIADTAKAPLPSQHKEVKEEMHLYSQPYLNPISYKQWTEANPPKTDKPRKLFGTHHWVVLGWVTQMTGCACLHAPSGLQRQSQQLALTAVIGLVNRSSKCNYWAACYGLMIDVEP